MPVIGITAASYPDPDGFDPMLMVESPYIESVMKAGGIPLMIPFLEDEKAISKIASKCDGFLFPGGKDVVPKLYGERPHSKLGETSEAQDQTEIALVKLALRENKPVLGICRGLQVINVALGGTLFQDLPSQHPTSVVHRHAETPEQFKSIVHPMKIVAGSRLFQILGGEEIGINTSHHQAINKLGAGLRITATSPDGIVEGIEHESHPFFVAVQGHPEVLWQNVEPRWKRYFEALIAHC